MEFNERLKNIRKRAHVTQKSIAEYLGITVRTYQRYEDGTIEPPLSTVSAISQYFDMPVDCLLGNGFFANWEELILNKEYLLDYLKKDVLSLPEYFDLSSLSESTLARLLPAIFAKITIEDGPTITVFPLVPTDVFPLVITLPKA